MNADMIILSCSFEDTGQSLTAYKTEKAELRLRSKLDREEDYARNS